MDDLCSEDGQRVYDKIFVYNPGFPELETRFVGYFPLPETRFFSTNKSGI